MRPVSDAFLQAVRGSHQMVATARVVAPGQIGVNPAGTDIPILGGDVQLDASQETRSTLELRTDGDRRWPTRAVDLLAPYGNEIHVRRGVKFGNGRTEWVSQGYFRIYTVEQDDAPTGPITIQARDRMSGIVDGRLTGLRAFSASTTYGAVVSALVTEIYPSAVIEWDDAMSGQAIGRQILAEEDRYAVLDDLVTSVGKMWWWDHRGHLVIRTPPATSSPVWEVSHGESGVLVSVGRRLTRDGVYNAVVAVGEGMDTTSPARAVVVDANPLSPTYWHGQFGKVPRFYSSPFITTSAQARSAAAGMLARQLGLPYAVDFAAVPNPALEPGDPIRVTYPGRSEVHVVDQLVVPLTAEAAMSAATREQTTVLLGGA